VAGRVSLSFVIHNHQPVGNFGWVIADVYERAYGPLIGALERHPGIHVGLHYTGALLDWMAENRPDSLVRIRHLVERGQVEMVGGGLYEPILVMLPDRDRHGQLVQMADRVEALFGERPSGAWVAERVWEPSLAYDLAAAGYRWTVLDDNHLRAASIPEDDMWTTFTTDDRGLRLTVFGTEQGLRYRIPFRPVEEVISYMRERVTPDGRFVGMIGDDGEKFGGWPGTFDYCWDREHWVDRLFEAIEREEWLATVTPSEWLAGHSPTTRVYIPNASYLEMTEWVLPPEELPTFVHLIERARDKNLPEARFLRGGFWRNYAARYREINDLHKQMLRTSAKVDAMPDGATVSRALDHLYQGQSNDCYWHGLFGGIYIVHMRMATLSHLIAAEDLADQVAADGGAKPYGARLADTDLDAIDEVLATSASQTVVVDLAEGAGISSWDLRASRVALGSVLRRRPEAYHQRLAAHELRAEEQALGEATGEPEADGPRSIHDMVNAKESGLTAYLRYDRHERRSGLVHLLPAGGTTTVEQLIAATYEELGDFVEGAYELETLTPDRVSARRLGSLTSGRSAAAEGSPATESSGPSGPSGSSDSSAVPVAVQKTFRFGGSRLKPALELSTTVSNLGAAPVAFELAVEWNVNLLGGGHNPAAYYETADETRTPHDIVGEVASAAHLAFGNDFEGVRVDASLEPAARLTWYPVETVSNSEGGFERVYQGSSLLFRWPVSLAAGEHATFCVSLAVTQTRDHSAEEAG
jgi:4-alpha-glucanotransferase